MSRPFVIVVAGAYRSGSTWMFNAVRLIMDEAGLTVATGDWRKAWRTGDLPDVDVLVIKEHRYRANLAGVADVVLTSIRAWDEVADSWERFKGERVDKGKLAAWRLNLRRWQEEDTHRYCMEYETLVDAPEEAFSRIWSSVPGASVACAERAWGRLQEVRPPSEGYDSETMLFSNHITQECSASS